MDCSDGAGATAAGGLDEADAAFFSRRRYRCCCCFSAPWQSSYARPAGTDEEWWHQVGDGRGGARVAGAGAAERRRWWRRGVDAFMKVREWSELVAGPRWKTFIRRFRRGARRHGGGGSGKLNYDALSYALNFDDGAYSPEDGGGGGGGAEFPDFSARFAAPPGSAKTSIDLGGRDPPSLFHHPLPHTPSAVATARA